MLYVEGARDREILGCWARRVEPGVARCIEKNTVILGGRRPARAVADFRKRRDRSAGLRGLVVLDRDDHADPHDLGRAATLGDGGAVGGESGLELFVWGLRHIESYLLVPAAIRRLLRLEADDQRVERVIAEQTEALRVADRSEQEAGPGSVHAKRILGAGGSLSEALGQELRAGQIARAMRSEDLHADVLQLFGRIGALAGVVDDGPEVVIRAPRSDR